MSSATDYSAPMNFSRIRVATASDLVGQSIRTADGRATGEVDYVLIEPVTGKVMYFLADFGPWYDTSDRLVAIPYHAVDIKRAANATNMQIMLGGDIDMLADAPRLSDAALSELTSPNVQYRIRSYWLPVTGEDGQTSSVQQGQGGMEGQSSGQQSGGQQSQSRQGMSGQGMGDQATASGSQSRSMQQRRAQGPGQGQTEGRSQGQGSQGQGQSGQQTAKATSGQGQSGQQTAKATSGPQAGQGTGRTGGAGQQRAQSGEYAQGQSGSQFGGQSQDRSRDQSKAQAQAQAQGQQGQQGQQGGQSFVLVSRAYITALTPPTVMRQAQIRGAEVVNNSGQSLGEIDKLVIDLDRGYVSYALVAEGGFLGIGEDFRPVPMQALRWQTGEKFLLSGRADQLQSAPRLKSADMPTVVRRSEVESLFDDYGVQPYWQQASQTSSGSGQQSGGSMSGSGSQTSQTGTSGRMSGQSGGQSGSQSYGIRSGSGSQSGSSSSTGSASGQSGNKSN